MPLDLPAQEAAGTPLIDLRMCDQAGCDQIASGAQIIEREDWYRYANCLDGSIYVRWDGVGQYVVSARGDHIACLPAAGAPGDSWQVYLLGQALSYALIRLGHEPLHATALEKNGRAFALLGDSGYGKSTLAAQLIDEGCRLITDDLLVVRFDPTGPVIYPGPQRLKLFPDEAKRFLRTDTPRVLMNPLTHKLIVPLAESQRGRDAVPVVAIYQLAAPEETRTTAALLLEPVRGQQAFLTLSRATFNRVVIAGDRLKRQFLLASALSSLVPIRKAVYPRDLTLLPRVARALLIDSGLESPAPA